MIFLIFRTSSRPAWAITILSQNKIIKKKIWNKTKDNHSLEQWLGV